MASNLAGSGLLVHDLHRSPEFLNRPLHQREFKLQMEGMWRLCHAFLHAPETILQELTDTAIYLCGADSAGISIAGSGADEDHYWHWTAVSGQFAHFRDATLPRHPSACGECLRQGCAQTLRVTQKFYDLMQIEAPLVSDGILIPWQVGESRGTIWILAHGRDQAFDREDLHTIEMLAEFAAMAKERIVRQRNALKRATAAAVSAMAVEILAQLDDLRAAKVDANAPESLPASQNDAELLAMLLQERLREFSNLVDEKLSN